MPDTNTTTEETRNAAELAEAARKEAVNKLPTTVKVMVDGKEEEVSVEKLKEHFQKESSADAKFRKAATMREEASRELVGAQRQKEALALLRKAQGGDAEAIKALPQYEDIFGFTEAHAKMTLKLIDEKTRHEEPGDPAPVAGPPAFEDLPDRAQKAIVKIEQQGAAERNSQAKNFILENLDKEKGLGYIFMGEVGKKRRNLLGDFALGVLRAETQQRGGYSAEALKAAMMRTKQYAEDLGLLGSQEDEPVPGALPGLPRAPASLSHSDLRQAAQPPKQIAADKAMNAEDYAANVEKRLAHLMMGSNKE